MSRRVVVLGSLAILVALGLWAGACSFGRLRAHDAVEPALPVRGGGVTISWARPKSGASQARRDAEDFSVASDRVQLLIANDGEGMERHLRYGALTALAARSDAKGAGLLLRSVLFVAGNQQPLRTLGVEVVRAGERPVLAVAEASHDGRFEVRTEYRLRPSVDYVEIVSTVTNLSAAGVAGVQLGDRSSWGGTTAFAPRLGYVHVPTRADVPWIGRPMGAFSYGFAYPDRPAATSFEFDFVGPSGEVVLSSATVLPPGGRAEFRREALVVTGGLGKLAELAWQRLGKPLGLVRGVLQPVPAWATISAKHPDGRTVLTVPAGRDGAYELALPAGEYRFALQAPGGTDEEEGDVAEGAELRLGLVPPRPGTLSFLLTDEREAPLSGRLVVRGVPPTKDPDLLPIEGEAGTKNMLYTLTGSGSLELPAGRYDVLATHGPEYAMPRYEIEVNADLGATFRGVLARTVDTRGYLAADFHVHASPSSDSSVSLRDRVLTLAAEGIELAVPTDHNVVTDYSEAIRERGLGAKLSTMSGVEITTLHWGHFNAYPYPTSLEVPPTHETSPNEIFSLVRARAPQAVLQVNHPRMPGVGYFNRGELDAKRGVAEAPDFSFAFDTLEVTNGFDLEDPSVLERNLREWFELLNVGRRYTAVGNSDSHHVVFQWAGWPRTYVRVPDQDPSRVVPVDVARALTSGHATVSCGIFVLPTANGSAGPGDTVLGPRVSLAISLRAPGWIDVSRVEVYANGAKVAERTRQAPLRSSVWNLDVDLELTADTWLVVVARGDEFMNAALPGKWIKPFGFSNPIYVDANSDGAFVAPGE